ncbi:ABC transporter permease [Oscillatoria sp. FACHB-1407]|uniref:ABC transporter permease n=1 Tax=Oscillatoria sp. FACHB-1407 TaxID=2692847 RepID=UPI001682B74A|nr:ABC transporter permease [Oscillatoria sp. FACHB-1407]MBD2461913.1 ABC transporter permease [Oscillatoria sp. FACHB-1407]
MDDLTGFLKLALITATPIALGAYAGIMSERAGVVNIAIEGMMLTGAMVAQLVAMYLYEPLQAALGDAAVLASLCLGVLAGVGSGALLGGLHGITSIRFKADQIISGTVINLLAWGVTGWVYQRWMTASGGAPTSPGTFPRIPIPFLSQIPVVGELLFNHQPLVYVMLLLTGVIYYVLFYTPWGLRTRAVGEHPRAADTVGINVSRVRYLSTLIGGAIAGLAGVWLSLEQVGTFTLRMSAGRGFIALAAMIFGRWTPLGAFGASLLFGLGTAIQIRAASLTSTSSALALIPTQLYQAIPYLLTIIVLAGFGGKATPPAASGQPYEAHSK